MKYRLDDAEVSVKMSRPARGAWIEIKPRSSYALSFSVAPRKGRVD